MAISFKKALGPELSKTARLQIAETNVDANYRDLDMIDYAVSPNTAPSTSQAVGGYEEPIVSVGEADAKTVTINGPFVPGTDAYLILEKVVASGATFFLRYEFRSQVILGDQTLSSSKTFALASSGDVAFAGTDWSNTGANSDPIKAQRNSLSMGMAIEFDNSTTRSIFIIDRFTPAATEADPAVIVSNPPESAISAQSSGTVAITVPIRRRTIGVRTVQEIGESGTVGELISGNIELVVDNDTGWEHLSAIE